MNQALLDSLEPKISFNAERLLRKKRLFKNEVIELYQHYKALEGAEMYELQEQRKQIEEKTKGLI
jgi:hypothetical protein